MATLFIYNIRFTDSSHLQKQLKTIQHSGAFIVHTLITEERRKDKGYQYKEGRTRLTFSGSIDSHIRLHLLTDSSTRFVLSHCITRTCNTEVAKNI